MTISSRTPEGEPNQCPICNASVRIDPSPLFGDATCPICGTLLWFLNLPPHVRIHDLASSQDIREAFIGMLAQILGVDPDKIASDPSIVNELGTDSLDLVELIMEVEEEFGS